MFIINMTVEKTENLVTIFNNSEFFDLKITRIPKNSGEKNEMCLIIPKNSFDIFDLSDSDEDFEVTDYFFSFQIRK